MHSSTKYIEETTCRKMQPNVYLMAKMPGEATAYQSCNKNIFFVSKHNTNAQTFIFVIIIDCFFWKYFAKIGVKFMVICKSNTQLHMVFAFENTNTSQVWLHFWEIFNYQMLVFLKSKSNGEH